jgi:hypothetical protein
MKKSSPSLWLLCGLIFLIGYVYLHKVSNGRSF